MPALMRLFTVGVDMMETPAFRFVIVFWLMSELKSLSGVYSVRQTCYMF